MTTEALSAKQLANTGGYLILAGILISVICAFIGAIAAFNGGSGAFLIAGAIPGLLLVAIGYLKRIAVTLASSRL